MTNQLKSLFIFIILVLIWGSAFILIKYGLKSFDGYQVAYLRVIAATVVLAPFVIGKLRQVKKTEWLFIAISGFVGSLGPAILFATGMQHGIASSTAGVLSALTPAFTLLLSSVIFKQRFGIVQILGLVLGFIGAISLLLSKSSEGLEFNNYGWLIVLATFMYALNLTLVKYKLKDTNSILISSFSLILTLPVTLTFLFQSDFIHRMETLPLANHALFYSLLLGILATGVALHLFNILIKISSPIFSSSITYAIPVISIFWALMDGEIVTFATYIPAAIIILSIYLIRYEPHKS